MSLLSPDDQPSLVDRPTTFEEIRNRPRYLAPLDHKTHRLKDVLTNYDFDAMVPCGLKGCGTLHKVGVLAVTEDGAETNMGWKCGKAHFGEDFTRARSEYTRRRERADLVARAKLLQANAPDIDKAIKDLVYRAYGGKWASRVTQSLTGVLGADIVESLRTSTIRDDLVVKESRERSKSEIESFMALNPGTPRDRALYEEIVVGRLLPAGWLAFDIRQELVIKLQEPLGALRTLDVEATTSPKLKAEVKRYEAYEGVLDSAAEAVASALRFLDESNLRLLQQWIPPHHQLSRDRLSSWINGPEHLALLQGTPK